MIYYDIFKKFDVSGLDYVIIGGVALVMHGVVRLTADLDLMAALDRGNLQKLIDAMADLGYRPRIPEPPSALLDPEKRRFWREEKNMEVFSFYAPAKPLALVDIMVHAPVDYSQIRSNAVFMSLGPLRVPVVSIDDLIRLKRVSSRPQDLEDIKSLEAIKKR